MSETGSWLCAQVVVAELVAGGVTEAVLAPGSRNAPLAHALQRAEASGALRLHVRVDERSAGFLALGLAKASGRVVPVVTTSGTAVGNLMPAVMEASHAHVPLFVLTADRPASMMNVGANQTTDQVHFFERQVRADARASAQVGTAASWRTAVHRLVAEALGVRSARPGPVHLNLELAEPLTPGAPLTGSPPVFSLEPAAQPSVTELAGSPRTVVVVGDATPDEGARAVRLAEAANLPLLSEPSGNARIGRCAIATYRLLLSGPLAGQIERVIVIGRPTLSRAVAGLLRRGDVELVVVTSHADWIDPGYTAARVVSAVACPPGRQAWLDAWTRADAAAQTAIDTLIAGQPADEPVIGLALSRAVVERLDAAQVLVIGSSSPVRDMDVAPIMPSQPAVYANRGLAGIDGTLSTAVGVALATGRPTTLAVGDLAFLHEVGGLLVPASEPQPRLRVVVGYDNGGAIFATLEQGAEAYANSFERLFGTPHDTDLGAIARGFGARVSEASSVAEVRRALVQPPALGVEVLLVHMDRQGRRALNEALNALGG